MSWTYTLSDDTTVTTGTSFLAVDAGTSSSTFEFRAWWYKGLSTGSTQSRLYFRPRVAGAYSGHPLLDQHAFEMRVVGSSNPDGNADFAPWTSSWTRVGTDAVMECPPLATNCALHLEVRLSPLAQHSGTTASVAYDIVPVYDETPPWEGDRQLAHGILTGVGDGETSEWIEQVAVAETGTPDDKANVAARTWLWFGTAYSAIAEAVTLNQDDGSSTTLSTGESYIALLSQEGVGSTVTTTKGLLASADPETPALPVGHLPIAAVEVVYDAGGSTIGTANITLDDDNVNSRFKPIAGTGLELLVAKGKAVSPTGGITQNDGEASVTLTASVTRYVWLLPGGAVAQTTANEPPLIGAIPLCTVVTDGSGPTTITDTRKYAERFDGAEFSESVTPNPDDALSLGAAGTRWRHVYVSRGILGSSAKALTAGADTGFVEIAVASGERISGEVLYEVFASDATDHQTLAGSACFTAVSKAGAVTAAVSGLGTPASALSSGTLTVSITALAGTGKITLRANAVSSLTETTLDIRYRVNSLSTNAITPL